MQYNINTFITNIFISNLPYIAGLPLDQQIPTLNNLVASVMNMKFAGLCSVTEADLNEALEKIQLECTKHQLEYTLNQ
ncbi:hypothetical protein [Scytonema sp. NUACC26]|uniref:hypothetical protein n=1 Tax=Scytonema sp. NUACC26 TaxID=3140176 RepID=UPI0034DC8E98